MLIPSQNVRGTFNIVSDALLKSPYWLEKVKELRWELSCGGARWIDYMFEEPSLEDEHLRQAIQLVQSLKEGKDMGS